MAVVELLDRAMRSVSRALARPWAQRGWRFLHHMSLHGMNVGEGADPRTSGEIHVMRQARKWVRQAGVERPVVVDCGANQGLWSRLAAAEWPEATILALEPARDTHARLLENVKPLPQVHALNVGLGEREETVRMYRPAIGDSGTSEVTSMFADAWEIDDSVIPLVDEVRLLPLRDLMEIQGVTYVDFLKLDVEGNEFPILRGARDAIAEGRVGLIQFEFGMANMRQGAMLFDFWRLLEPTHDIHRILPAGLWRVPEWSATLEVPICTNFLAIPRAHPLAGTGRLVATGRDVASRRRSAPAPEPAPAVAAVAPEPGHGLRSG